ncbi:hypothetical protein AD944_10755 [Acetobacter tropicalis]|nr:hypothetical protein AD944_10755 [Acetobacter tropicalis]
MTVVRGVFSLHFDPCWNIAPAELLRGRTDALQEDKVAYVVDDVGQPNFHGGPCDTELPRVVDFLSGCLWHRACQGQVYGTDAESDPIGRDVAGLVPLPRITPFSPIWRLSRFTVQRAIVLSSRLS